MCTMLVGLKDGGIFNLVTRYIITVKRGIWNYGSVCILYCKSVSDHNCT